MPRRIKLERTKGWRLQEVAPGAVKVDRRTKCGNPFTKAHAIESGYATEANWQAFVVRCFREWLGGGQVGRDWWQGLESDQRKAAILDGLNDLRGHDLACWCKPGDPCHADVLLELANRPLGAVE